MVAVVNQGRSIRNILQYNENKTTLTIDQQKSIKAATLIHANGFAKDIDGLRFADKLKSFEKLTSLNERTKVNAIHISLNFDPSEQGLSTNKLQEIAISYMDQLGFGGQPYLVYKHNDASHPHIHIVTTNIQANGKRIKLHNIGRDKSEKARKNIEKVFNLVRADDKQRHQQFELAPINVKKVVYGKSPEIGTKRAITNVLDYVLPNYKYTSLAELNAVLRNYNVIAHQGGKDSRTHQRNGLYYQILGENGKQVGKPIPASDFYNKPTMVKLQEFFAEKELQREGHKRRIKNAVDLHFFKKSESSMAQLEEALRKDNIQMVIRQNDQGTIYGLTYIDHKTKCVFNGSDLGKEYSANRVQQRLKLIDQASYQTPVTEKQTTREPSKISKPEQDHFQQNGKSQESQMPQHTPPYKPQQGGMAAELSQDPSKRRRRKKLRY
ncbi:relaxase/mobilization nuclease domain-containing protein [Paraflavitalea pollutisoli]|uniref:relaxase/mobilization nuclease domain-containing protein n=1 Tax=Paraflavitalea pollutisoli TaxID=3034143 RepID=UPI0023EA99F2|nr:relaxase/mobilization nuclease domain-containing protein [Paraflavitalea sp. H1-2-19X]